MTTQTTFCGIDLSKKAPWWKLLLARLFGKTAGGCDGTTIIRGYYWRGKLYIKEFDQNLKHMPAEEFNKWLKAIRQQ